MKKRQWICLLVLTVLCITMLGGCAGTQEEERGVTDSFVSEEKEESKEDTSKEESPQEDTLKEDEPKEEDLKEDTPKEETPKEEDPKEEDPKEEDPKEEDPKEETPTDPDEGEEDLPPITKEESGTAITFLMQNLRTAGNQTGLDPKERSNGDLNLYRRKFRFKKLVQAQDPDVILAQEATPGWLDFFKTDPYFSKTYTMVWTYRKPGSGVEMATPVLYKTAKYSALESGHFWWSDTPKFSSPTYGYTEADGEGHYRPCSWVKLKDKETGGIFYAYSIHIDAGNDVVAYKSLQQLNGIFDRLGKDAYAFAGGDFNFGFRDDYYKMAVDWAYETDLQEMAHNMNADGLCELGGTNGSLHTKYNADDNPATADVDEGYFQGVFPDPDPGRKRQLDHIFAKNHANLAVDYWGFDYTDYEDSANQVEKGYISDHYGLVCKVRIDTEVDYSRYQVEYDGKPGAAES